MRVIWAGIPAGGGTPAAQRPLPASTPSQGLLAPALVPSKNLRPASGPDPGALLPPDFASLQG